MSGQLTYVDAPEGKGFGPSASLRALLLWKVMRATLGLGWLWVPFWIVVAVVDKAVNDGNGLGVSLLLALTAGVMLWFRGFSARWAKFLTGARVCLSPGIGDIWPQHQNTAVNMLVSWVEIWDSILGGLVGLTTSHGEKSARLQCPYLSRLESTDQGLHLLIEMHYGQSFETFNAKSAELQAAWRVPSLSVTRVNSPAYCGFILGDGRDVLMEKTVETKEIPVGPLDPSLRNGLPVALDQTRKIVRTSPFHTLIVGGTGSGKGSMLWGLMRAFDGACGSEYVRFWGIDPKRSEVLAGERIFCRVAYDPETIANLFEDLGNELAARRDRGERSFTPTPDRPWLVVVIDEATSLLGQFTDTKQRSKVEAQWRTVLSQGRSLGIVCIGAGQEATKEALKVRDLFPVRIAGRLQTPTETNLVLGDGSVESGATPHLIPVANPSNGYVSAGLAWMRVDGEGFSRVRFAFVPDSSIQTWAQTANHSGHGCPLDQVSADPSGC